MQNLLRLKQISGILLSHIFSQASQEVAVKVKVHGTAKRGKVSVSDACDVMTVLLLRSTTAGSFLVLVTEEPSSVSTLVSLSDRNREPRFTGRNYSTSEKFGPRQPSHETHQGFSASDRVSDVGTNLVAM